MPRTSEKIVFKNEQGQELAGRLDRPEGAPAAFALFAHCFTCTKDVPAASRIARRLAERGIAVLRFDFTGLGGSDGEFENTDFSSNVGDLVAAAAWLREHHVAPQLLVGHSLGGAAVLAAARRLEEVRAVVTIGAPSEPEHVKHLLRDGIERIEAEGEAEVDIGGRPFRIRRDFLEDLERHRLGDELGAWDKALLVMHSPVDRTVGIEHAERIYKAARGPRSFVSLNDADHLLSDAADAAYVADVLAAWVSRYVDVQDESPVRVSAPPPGTVRVEQIERPFTNAVRTARHSLLADEPADHHGADRGPSPYEYLAAALGACTSMTLRMYADHKQWPLESVRVDLVHEKIDAAECEDCETREGKVDRITRTIELRGELDGEQRQRLLEIADRCPVHRTLHGEVKVVSRLA